MNFMEWHRGKQTRIGVNSLRELQPRTVVTRRLENVVARPAAGLASCPFRQNKHDTMRELSRKK